MLNKYLTPQFGEQIFHSSNPTRNQIIIEDGKFISVKVCIYGKLVLNQNLANRKININHFKSGVYI